ncbi:hypothetical protein GCM10017687_63850 [Streptomyces echinatus]
MLRWRVRGRVALGLVAAGVVDADRGPGGQFGGEQRVVVVEGRGVAGAYEIEGAQDLAPGHERYGQVGVHAGLLEEGGGLTVAGDALQIRARGAEAPGPVRRYARTG